MSDEEKEKESEEVCIKDLGSATSEGEGLAREESSEEADEEGAEGDAFHSPKAGNEQGRDQRLLRDRGQEVDASTDQRTEDGVPPCLRKTWDYQRRYGRRWHNL